MNKLSLIIVVFGFVFNISKLSAHKLKGILLDCSNTDILLKVKMAKIPYSCLDKKPERRSIDSSGSAYVINADLDATSPETDDCSDPKRCLKKCPPGYIYSSEIDICLESKNPPVKDTKPEALSLIQGHHGIKGCLDGTFYLSELDICAPMPSREDFFLSDQPELSSSHKVKDKEHSILTTEEPIPLTLSPISEGVGRQKCPPGTVYVSEIDLCLEA